MTHKVKDRYSVLSRNGQKGYKKNKKPVKQNIKGKMSLGTTGITKPFVQKNKRLTGQRRQEVCQRSLYQKGRWYFKKATRL